MRLSLFTARKIFNGTSVEADKFFQNRAWRWTLQTSLFAGHARQRFADPLLSLLLGLTTQLALGTRRFRADARRSISSRLAGQSAFSERTGSLPSCSSRNGRSSRWNTLPNDFGRVCEPRLFVLTRTGTAAPTRAPPLF